MKLKALGDLETLELRHECDGRHGIGILEAEYRKVHVADPILGQLAGLAQFQR